MPGNPGGTHQRRASWGMPQQRAITDHDIAVGIASDDDLIRPVADGHPDGFCKLIADRHSHAVLGAHVLGEYSAETVQVVATAKRAGMNVEQLGYVDRWAMLVVPLAGIAVAVLAIIYAEATGKATSDVLFSGQDALDPLITQAASYSVGALLLLMVCKGLAYCVSLSSFRGGPISPAMFIGAAGGIALSHLPGLPLIAGVAMGISAMTVVMLTLPLTSVLLATLLLAADGLALMPLVIVAVIVAHVAAARIAPPPAAQPNGNGQAGGGAHAEIAALT